MTTTASLAHSLPQQMRAWHRMLARWRAQLRLRLHSAALIERLLNVQRASGGMIAAAPTCANTDAGALLPAPASLGADERNDTDDRRAKHARARLGAGLHKVQLHGS